MMPKVLNKESELPKEMKERALQLYEILQRIHNRLIAEGKIKIEDGKVQGL